MKIKGSFLQEGQRDCCNNVCCQLIIRKWCIFCRLYRNYGTAIEHTRKLTIEGVTASEVNYVMRQLKQQEFSCLNSFADVIYSYLITLILFSIQELLFFLLKPNGQDFDNKPDPISYLLRRINSLYRIEIQKV